MAEKNTRFYVIDLIVIFEKEGYNLHVQIATGLDYSIMLTESKGRRGGD